MDRLWTRPDTFRLFARIEGVSLDATGNARSARVSFLDHDPRAGLAWFDWEVGQCLHWHPFRMALLSTRRAGLHLVGEWRDGGGELRYGRNHHVARDGILVLAPCNLLTLAEPLDSALADDEERVHLDAVLRSRFGLNATDLHPTRRLWRLPRAECGGRRAHWGTHPLAGAAAA